MRTTHKPTKGTKGRKQAASVAGRALSPPKKAAAASANRREDEVIGPRQLEQADKMLVRIERRGEALSATADRLLRRVS